MTRILVRIRSAGNPIRSGRLQKSDPIQLIGHFWIGSDSSNTTNLRSRHTNNVATVQEHK